MVSATTKLVCSVIGGVFFNFSFSSMYVFQTLSPYLFSYHMIKYPNLALPLGYLFSPVFELTMYVFSPLSSIIENKLKCHL